MKTSPAIPDDDVEPLAAFLVMACSSMLQTASLDHTVDRETVRFHMQTMVRGYLREMVDGADQTYRP